MNENVNAFLNRVTSARTDDIDKSGKNKALWKYVKKVCPDKPADIQEKDYDVLKALLLKAKKITDAENNQ